MKSILIFIQLTILLANLGIFHLPLFASDKGKIKYQIEVSLDITETRARKILSHYEFESKERTDYVFDAYNGSNFLLFPSSQKIRFRLKAEENKNVIQINRNTIAFPRVCENGIKILIRERKSGELNASGKQYKALIHGNNILEKFTENPTNAGKLLKNFSQTLQKLNIPLQSELEKSLGDKNWIYLPINVSKKKKWKKNLDFEYGQITVSLSQGKDFIGKIFLQEKWELEFQVHPSEWKENKCRESYCGLEKSICQFLKTENISKEDLDPIKISPYNQVKEIVSPYNQELGF